MQDAQLRAWQQCIMHERSNAQRLEPDSPVLIARVLLTYSQALTVLWFHPEVGMSAGGFLCCGPTQRQEGWLPTCEEFVRGGMAVELVGCRL